MPGFSAQRSGFSAFDCSKLEFFPCRVRCKISHDCLQQSRGCNISCCNVSKPPVHGNARPELLAPRNAIENEWFIDKANELGLGKFWLGINDRDAEGQYNDQHGSPHNYFNWANNEPTGTNGQNCVQTGGGYGYKWDDVGCTTAKKVLCTHIVGKAQILNQAFTENPLQILAMRPL